jgi:hypothetical protein
MIVEKQEEELRKKQNLHKGLNIDSLERARFDSLTRLKAEKAALDAAERARIEAREKARFDSIAMAKVLKQQENEAYLLYLHALDKSMRDSLMAIFIKEREVWQALLQKEILRFDSIAKVRELQAAEAERTLREIEVREKVRFDSIAKARKRNEELARQKRIDGEYKDQLWRDSIAFVKKNKEDERTIIVAKEMARYDSIARLRNLQAAQACALSQELVEKQIEPTANTEKNNDKNQVVNTDKVIQNIRLIKYKEPKMKNGGYIYGSVDYGDGLGSRALDEKQMLEYMRIYPFRIE